MTRIATALVVLLACGAPAAAEPEESTCVTCHLREEEALPEAFRFEHSSELSASFEFSRPVAEWRESVHARHEVSCDACHGGDPFEEDEDLSMSEEAGFLELPSWKEMATHCGVCHEEIAAHYTAGRFGRALADGKRVANCSTCHMYRGHYIVESTPEEIRVEPRCARCLPVEEPEATQETLRDLRARQAELGAQVAGVEAAGIELTDVRDDLGALREAFAADVHSFEPGRLAAAAARTRSRLAELETLVSELEREAARRRRYGVALLVLLALLTAGLFGYRGRSRE